VNSVDFAPSSHDSCPQAADVGAQMWNLISGACCAPSPDEELKFQPYTEQDVASGYARVKVLPGSAAWRTDSIISRACGEQCCDEGKETSEMVVVPQAPSVELPRTMSPRNGAGPVVSSESPELDYRAGYNTYSHASVLENGQVGYRESTPVPQIIGLSNLQGFPEESDRDQSEIEVNLIREGQHWSNLGMLVSPNASNPDCLTIDEIDECSLLGEWNAGLPRSHQVYEGDVIVAVNGRSGRELIGQIQQTSSEGSRLKLRILRSAEGRPY